MKVAIIGDTHAGARGDKRPFQNNMRRFFKNEFFPKLKEEGITNIIHTGDLFDRRKYINFNTLQLIRECFLDVMKKEGISFRIIYGNHDVAYKNTNTLNSLDLFLNEYSNIEVVRKPSVFVYNGSRIALVPWINEENEEETMNFIGNNSSVDLLCGHFDIMNFEFTPGVKNIEKGIEPSTFADYKQVVSGHYHVPGSMLNIMYPGSPFEFTWNDYGQEKGYVIYDTKNKGINKVPTQARMFYKVFYDDEDDFKLKKTRSFFKLYTDKFVKVIVKKKDNKKKFDAFLNDIYSFNPHDVSVVESDETFVLSEDQINTETKSTMEIINSTIDNMTLNVPTQELKTLFSELYSESLSLEVE